MTARNGSQEERSFAPVNKRVNRVEKVLAEHLEDCLRQREEMHESIKGLGTKVDTVTTDVGTMKTSVSDMTDLVSGAKRLIWRGLIGLVGIIATAAGTILVQSWFSNKTVAEKADTAAAVAQYTRQDAARDRAELLSLVRQMRDEKK